MLQMRIVFSLLSSLRKYHIQLKQKIMQHEQSSLNLNCF